MAERQGAHGGIERRMGRLFEFLYRARNKSESQLFPSSGIFSDGSRYRNHWIRSFTSAPRPGKGSQSNCSEISFEIYESPDAGRRTEQSFIEITHDVNERILRSIKTCRRKYIGSTFCKSLERDRRNYKLLDHTNFSR